MENSNLESIILAVRENDQQAFVDQVELLSATEINAANTFRYASWFSGVGATLLQLTSLAIAALSP